MSMAGLLTRRDWAARTTTFLGGLALAGLMNGSSRGSYPGMHHAARARRVIFLFQSGGPSQMDLFDPKPTLKERHGQEIPPSVRGSQRTPPQSRDQGGLPLVGSPFAFKPAGRSGVELSELLPHTAGVVDDITLIRSAVTDPINHDPGAMMWMTGGERPGRPALGAWLSYGLGSANENLPEYVVMLSGEGGQPLQSSYWGSGFLPTRHQGTQFRPTGDQVLYLADPPGLNRAARRRVVEGVAELNRLRLDEVNDEEIAPARTPTSRRTACR